DQAGARAVGDSQVSLLDAGQKPQASASPGEARSMRDARPRGAPQDGAKSLLASDTPAKPGEHAHSIRDQAPVAAPGAGTVSQMGGTIAKQGQGAHSLQPDSARPQGKPGESLRDQGPIAGS